MVYEEAKDMSEEKMMILKMLEQGKITPSEATELLNAVKDKEKNVRPTSSVQTDFGKKVEILSKDLEPKLKKATKTIFDKTAYFADKLSRTLSDSSTFSPFIGGKEKTVELHVGSKYNAELRFNGKNGMIYIKGYNGDKITAKINYIPKDSSHDITLIESGNIFYLNYDEGYFNRVAVEAFVPDTLFKKLYLETNNDQIIIDGFKAEEMTLYNSNGAIELKNIKTGKLEAETSNGRILLENISGKYMKAETSNGKIQAKQCDIEKMEIATSEAEILLDVSLSKLEESDFYQWSLETSNGAVKMNTLKDSRVGYNLKANTSLNGVQVNIGNMDYKVNEKNYVKGISNHYSMAEKKISLDLETSNAPIIIN